MITFTGVWVHSRYVACCSLLESSRCFELSNHGYGWISFENGVVYIAQAGGMANTMPIAYTLAEQMAFINQSQPNTQAKDYTCSEQAERLVESAVATLVPLP